MPPPSLRVLLLDLASYLWFRLESVPGFGLVSLRSSRPSVACRAWLSFPSRASRAGASARSRVSVLDRTGASSLRVSPIGSSRAAFGLASKVAGSHVPWSQSAAFAGSHGSWSHSTARFALTSAAVRLPLGPRPTSRVLPGISTPQSALELSRSSAFGRSFRSGVIRLVFAARRLLVDPLYRPYQARRLLASRPVGRNERLVRSTETPWRAVPAPWRCLPRGRLLGAAAGGASAWVLPASWSPESTGVCSTPRAAPRAAFRGVGIKLLSSASQASGRLANPPASNPWGVIGELRLVRNEVKSCYPSPPARLSPKENGLCCLRRRCAARQLMLPRDDHALPGLASQAMRCSATVPKAAVRLPQRTASRAMRYSATVLGT